MFVLKSTYDAKVKFLQGRFAQHFKWLSEADDIHSALEKHNVELTEEIKRLKTELNDRPLLESFNPNDDSIGDAPIFIDWYLMNAVSIERIYNEVGYPITVVSYRPSAKKKLEEWYFHCNDDRHQELANDFVDYIHNRNAQ